MSIDNPYPNISIKFDPPNNTQENENQINIENPYPSFSEHGDSNIIKDKNPIPINLPQPPHFISPKPQVVPIPKPPHFIETKRQVVPIPQQPHFIAPKPQVAFIPKVQVVNVPVIKKNDNNDIYYNEKISSNTKIECEKIFGKIQPFGPNTNEGAILITKTYNINIIFYDEDLTRDSENNYYCSYFKSKLEGTFYGINHFNLFQYICHKIQQNQRNFILITTGKYAEKIFNFCEQNNINKIYKYYIYCIDRTKYISLLGTFPNLKGIFINFGDLVNEIFHKEKIENYHIKSTYLMFLNDYNDIYIKLHYEIIRKYSLYKLFKSNNFDKTKFMELVNTKFPYYLNIARELIYNDDEAMIKFFKGISDEENLRKIFNNNHDIKNYISNYTLQNFYEKYINKFLRESDFRSFRILSNHICKLIYHLYEYRKTHFQLNDSILFRNKILTNEELNLYQSSIGKIICYPNFFSTFIKNDNIFPLKQKEKEIPVKFIIQQNNSPSIIRISDLSLINNGEEFLCLPFTFFKIKNVKKEYFGNTLLDVIYLIALNSEKPIEDMFLEFMENETDNLDPEGLEMIKLADNETRLILNPCLKAEIYKNCKFEYS